MLPAYKLFVEKIGRDNVLKWCQENHFKPETVKLHFDGACYCGYYDDAIISWFEQRPTLISKNQLLSWKDQKINHDKNVIRTHLKG